MINIDNLLGSNFNIDELIKDSLSSFELKKSYSDTGVLTTANNDALKSCYGGECAYSGEITCYAFCGEFCYVQNSSCYTACEGVCQSGDCPSCVYTCQTDCNCGACQDGGQCNCGSCQYGGMCDCGSCQSCQICNNCMAMCEKDQTISNDSRIGKFDFSQTVNLIEAINVNELKEYVIKAGKLTNKSFTIGTATKGNIIKPTEFNAINQALNSFTDTSTGLSDRALNMLALKTELNKLKDTANAAKFDTDIPCCQVTGHQYCITREA